MTIILFATLLWQIIDFLRELADWRNQRSAIVTQFTAWIGGVLVIFLFAHASVTAAWTPPGFTTPLGHLDVAGVIIIGLLASSLASSAVDLKQALDGTDSNAKPPLLPPAPLEKVPPTPDHV